MNWLRSGSAIILGLIVWVIGFMLYHKQTTLPLADVMSTQNSTIQWDISYQLSSSTLTISNTSSTLIGTLSIAISYDPTTVKLLTDQITSEYEYSFDAGRQGTTTIFVDGTLAPGQLISIPLQWDSNNISIASPSLISNDSTSSLSITRVE
jgi:hypothetical protein